MALSFIPFAFPGAPGVRCAFQTRDWGVSEGPYGGGNIAYTVGDDPLRGKPPPSKMVRYPAPVSPAVHPAGRRESPEETLCKAGGRSLKKKPAAQAGSGIRQRILPVTRGERQPRRRKAHSHRK